VVRRSGEGVHHGAAGQGVEQQGDRRVPGQFAALDAAADDGARGEYLGPLPVLVVLGHAGDGAGLQAEPQRGPAGGAGIEVKHLHRQLDEVAAQRAGIHVGHPGHPQRERVNQQRLLAAPAQVQRGLADPGPPGDRLHREAGPAGVAEQVERRLRDPAVHVRVARTAGCRVRGGHRASLLTCSLKLTGSPRRVLLSGCRQDIIREHEREAFS